MVPVVVAGDYVTGVAADKSRFLDFFENDPLGLQTGPNYRLFLFFFLTCPFPHQRMSGKKLLETCFSALSLSCY